LDEIECLRITLLEWQTRPVTQLRDGLSDTEAASLRDALGSEDYGLGRNDSPAPGRLADPAFQSQERRRARLVALYMQEQTSAFQIPAVLTDILVQLELMIASGSELPSDLSLAGRLNAAVNSNLQTSVGGLTTCFDGLKDCLERMDKGPCWIKDSFASAELLDDWTCTLLSQVCALVELMLLHQNSPGSYTETQHTLSWLRLMSEANFFITFEPQSERQSLLWFKVQALASTCTLAVLYLSEATGYIELIRASPEVQLDPNTSPPYFMDPDAAAEIHHIMMSFVSTSIVHAGPAMLAWGLILGNVREVAATSKELREATHVQRALDNGSRESSSGRRLSSSSIGSIQQSPSEDVMDSIRSVSHGEDDIDDLNQAAVVASNVFHCIAQLCSSEALRTPAGIMAQARIFQQLIITSIAQMEYTDGIVAAQLAVIDALADTVAEFRESADVYGLQIRGFHEQSGVREVLEVAASRFPHETMPFLQLCSSLTRLEYVDDDGHDYIVAFLQNLPTFTQMAIPDFTAYQTIREHENANLVSLDANLDMLGISESQRLIDALGQVTELSNSIPSGTIGEVISEGRPPVIKWLHSYSGFAYMGFWLNSFRCGHLQANYQDQDHLEDIAAVIFELLSRTLSSNRFGFAAKLAYTSSLLADIANGLPEDVDLASILFDICEQQLQSLRYRKQNPRGCDVVVACLRLVTTLLPLLPNRIWSLLSRSALVDTRSTSGGVFSIILSIETIQEKYDFLEAYSDLYQAMVEDAVRQSVGITSAPSSGRITVSDQTTKGSVPTRIVSSVVQASTRTMMESFQAASRWKFASSSQRMRIATKLSETFQAVLEYTYGTDDAGNLSGKLTAGLAPSAMYIADVLRPHAEEALEPCCLLRWLLVSWQHSAQLSSLSVAFELSRQVCAISSLTKVALSVGILLNSSHSALEAQILDALPVFVRLGTMDTDCTFSTLDMLQALLRTMSTNDAPSLLGRLGSASARAFVESLLPTIRQSGSIHLRIKVWDIFTSLVTHSQQWFAIILIQGCPPDSKFRKSHLTCTSTKQTHLRGKAVLAEALDYITAIDRQSLKVVISVLNFVVKSQRHWSWVTDSVQTHPELFRSLITFMNNMSSEDSHSPVQSQSNKIAALIVELATVQLHFARSKRDTAMIQKMIPLMRWATNNAINVDDYNVSLHSNLRKNFSARYDTATLANFKRTQLLERPYGEDFYYNIDLAERVLSHRGVDTRRPDFDKTFRQELVRVNVNLSLVDSQMRLLDSFQSFCVEHCTFFCQAAEVQRMMASVVQNLLTANTTSPPPERIFETLFQTRADFALVMIRRLAEIKPKGSEFSHLLSAAWNALRFRNTTYEFAIDNDDLVYFRTTLTILLLAMQFHTDKRDQGQDRLALVSTVRDPTSSIIVEIASVIVADGLKSIVSSIHDQATKARNKEASPETLVDAKDVAITLAILQAILRLHILPQIASQLASGFVSSNILQSCLLLYSWSHTLTTPSTDHEPIYADLSLRFLVSLSSLPQVAEELGVEGVLSRVSTARITQLLRTVNGASCQFDTRPHVAALYRVWTAGILPLCLNLLHSVGRAMAGEVAVFLNQFQAQLTRASKAFRFHGGSGEPLTLVRANEGAVLALISRILAQYRVAGASAGVDAYEVPALEGYDEERGAVGDDIREICVGGRLRVAVVAVGEKEIVWQRTEVGTGAGTNKLEGAIVAELRNVLACLDGLPGR
jgi:nuclear pore complex protein Nup188